MKRLIILVILISLIAVVSNAADFMLLANEPSSSGSQNFSDFGTWFLVGSFCTGAGLLFGMVAAGDQNDRFPAVVIGTSLGFGTAMTVALMSSSGLSINEQVGFRLIPVVLGAAVAIIVVPVAILAGLFYIFMGSL
jgi:hypothetical protein